jgi:hypothetical protein
VIVKVVIKRLPDLNQLYRSIIMKLSTRHLIAPLALFLSVTAVNAFAYTGEKLAGEAKLTIDQARTIALKIHPGKIVEESLEREKGRLLFSFDIRDGKVTHEVSVDAKTGKIKEQ